MIKKPEAIIFDMDGLLIDSEPLWYEAEKKVFDSVGISLNEEMILDTKGLRADEMIDYWYKKFPWKEPTRSELLDKLIDLIISLIEERASLLPGAERAISMSSELDCKVALASSSHMRIVNSVINKFKLDNFDSIHSAETELKGKPDPAVYLTACKALGVKPENCLAFEDSINGVRAAKAAGMYCVAVPAAEERKDERFKEADDILNSLEEINKDWILDLFNKKICPVVKI